MEKKSFQKSHKLTLWLLFDDNSSSFICLKHNLNLIFILNSVILFGRDQISKILKTPEERY